MLRVCDSAAWSAGSLLASAFLWPSPSGDEVGTPIKVISELNGWPACAPVNASPATSRPPAHDSGSSWFATPCLYGSFIRDSMPVYPGAPPAPFFLLCQRHGPLHPPQATCSTSSSCNPSAVATDCRSESLTSLPTSMSRRVAEFGIPAACASAYHVSPRAWRAWRIFAGMPEGKAARVVSRFGGKSCSAAARIFAWRSRSSSVSWRFTCFSRLLLMDFLTVREPHRRLPESPY